MMLAYLVVALFSPISPPTALSPETFALGTPTLAMVVEEDGRYPNRPTSLLGKFRERFASV